MSALVLLVVGLPALSALFVVCSGAGRSERSARVSTCAAAAAFLIACALAIEVGVHGAVSAVLADHEGRQIVGLYANRIIVVLLLLVCGVSAVVQAFACGYLRGDLRAGRFFAGTSLLTAATAAMVSAASIVGLGVAWTLAGVALCALLNMYSGLPAARQGLQRTALSFAIGDCALWAAIVFALVRWGNLDLRHLSGQARALTADPDAVSVFSCLVLVAAMARSAQLPLQRWLPATLAAPTPVSALLHAGVINAGGVLLVRLGALVGTSRPAGILMFCVGGATVVYGTVLMLTKPDIKGSLAHSTMGQMGFMIMTCGLGAFAAAIFHLVAHGMYKATLFLGSGGAVHRQLQHAKAPPRASQSAGASALTALVAAGMAGAAMLSASAVLHPHASGTSASGTLLLFGWATAAATTWGILRRRVSALTTVAGVALMGAGTWAYVGWLRLFTGFLSVDLSSAGQNPAPSWLLAPVVLVLIFVAAVRLSERRLRSLHDAVYVRALSAGHVLRAREPRVRREARPVASPWALLQPGSGTARP